MINSSRTIRAFLLAGSAGIATAAMLLPAAPARADDCLLDTSNDGTATAGVDSDLAANSGGDDSRLACGEFAQALGTPSVAIGPDGVDIDAIGASATGQN